MKINIVFCICLFLLNTCDAQIFYLYGDKTFGGNKKEFGGNIRKLNDYLLICGSSETNIDGDKSDSLCNPGGPGNPRDLWFLQIDSSFNIIWQNDIGGNMNDNDPLFNVTASGKIFFSAVSFSDSSCDKSESNRGNGDYWFGELDSIGNILWNKTLGGNVGENGTKIVQYFNQLIVSGQSLSGVSGDKSVPNFGNWDYWIIKTDSVGNKISEFVYGSNGYEMQGNFYDLLILDNSSLLLTGCTYGAPSGQVTDTSRGGHDLWIVEIDSLGSIKWQKRYGGNDQDWIKRTLITNDNNYLLAGITISQQSGEVSQPSLGGEDFWLIKIDTSGNIIWDKRFGGPGNERANWIDKTSDGGFWVAGTTTSPAGGQISEPAFGTTDYWIIRIDSVGNLLWEKRFGGPGDNILTSYALLADSSIMLFGYADSGTSSVKTDPGKGDTDYWLVHFYYGSTHVGIVENQRQDDFSIFPNPVEDQLTISVNSDKNRKLIIYDVTGRIVIQKEIHKSTSIDVSAFLQGIYCVEISDKNGIRGTKKLIKI